MPASPEPTTPNITFTYLSDQSFFGPRTPSIGVSPSPVPELLVSPANAVEANVPVLPQPLTLFRQDNLEHQSRSWVNTPIIAQNLSLNVLNESNTKEDKEEMSPQF